MAPSAGDYAVLGWWVDAAVPVGVVSGDEDFLSRSIGMRLLSDSWVTRWGLFLRRGGFDITHVDV